MNAGAFELQPLHTAATVSGHRIKVNMGSDAEPVYRYTPEKAAGRTFWSDVIVLAVLLASGALDAHYRDHRLPNESEVYVWEDLVAGLTTLGVTEEQITTILDILKIFNAVSHDSVHIVLNILEPLIKYSGPGAPALLRAEGQTASSLQKILLHDANKERKSLLTLARSVGRPAAMHEWNRRTMFPIARHNGMATYSDAPKKVPHKQKK